MACGHHGRTWQPTNEQCRGEDLNGFEEHEIVAPIRPRPTKNERFNQWRDDKERDYISRIAAKVEWAELACAGAPTRAPCSDEGGERNAIACHHQRKITAGDRVRGRNDVNRIRPVLVCVGGATS